MGKTGHGGYAVCTQHMKVDTGEKGRDGPTTRIRHRKSSGPANWRKSTIKVSPCDHCASNNAAVRAQHWRAKARSFSQGELIEACKKLLGSYKKRAALGETPDAYADVFLPFYTVVHPYDYIFVKQVLFGYCRYKKMIDTFVNKLYLVKGTLISPDDVLLYRVLSYLAFVWLDELNWQEFRRLCSSQAPRKLLPFVQAVFLEELTLRYAKEEWVQIYDDVFINDLLQGLSIFSQQAQDYAEKLAEIVCEPNPNLRYIPPPIMAIPFNLSVSNYTHPVEEELEPFIYKAKPAPDWDKGRTLEMKRVSQVFKLNRVLLKDKYTDPNYQPFRLRSLERPTNLDTIREEVEAKRAKECEYYVAKSAPIPKMPEIEVKLTAATLLREHARFQKNITIDKKKLKNLERELRDDAHLKTYEEGMRMQEEIEKAIDTEFQRATVIASDRAARDAKKKHLCINWAAASVVKEGKERTHHEYSLLVKNLLFMNRFRHHLVKEEAKEVKVVKKKLYLKKKNLVKELNAESDIRLAVAALQRTREHQCKQELVRQLHFLEKESCYRIPKFDIYTAGNHGCLEEMSIAELREQLVQVKQWHLAEEERKRKEVQLVQMKKRQMLLDTARVVTQMRQITRAQYLSKKAHEEMADVPEVDPANQIGM